MEKLNKEVYLELGRDLLQMNKTTISHDCGIVVLLYWYNIVHSN